jgi:acetylxylan esterase
MDFLSLYTTAPPDSNCWDLGSNKSPTRGGDGDSTGLVQQYDPVHHYDLYSGSEESIRNRLHVWCDVTNVISAIYPDVITAGSAYFGEQLVA